MQLTNTFWMMSPTTLLLMAKDAEQAKARAETSEAQANAEQAFNAIGQELYDRDFPADIVADLLLPST
jgi:hypothetical protein